MIILITVLHVLVCVFLIVVVLLQSGKAGDISAAFGGQGSQAAFGPRGAATTLSRATTISAVLFMLTSVTLSINALKQGGAHSVLQGVKSGPVKTQPASSASIRPLLRQPELPAHFRRNFPRNTQSGKIPHAVSGFRCNCISLTRVLTSDYRRLSPGGVCNVGS